MACTQSNNDDFYGSREKELSEIKLEDFINYEKVNLLKTKSINDIQINDILDKDKLELKLESFGGAIYNIDYDPSTTNVFEGTIGLRLNISYIPTYKKYIKKTIVKGFLKEEVGYLKNQYFSKTINNKSNELILLSALQNIGLLFENTNKNNGSEFFSFNGTIIDYKINENENYPLTWYVLTSAIAANQNKNQNNYEPYVINDNENISSKLYLYNVFNNKILNDSASIENIIKEKDSINDNLTKNITVIDDVKTVFVGNDIFTSKPNDFDDNYNENQEEMINASILEITFENEEIAKKLTNNLFNLLKNSKNNYDLINFLKNDVYLKLSNTNEPNILDYHSFQNLISTSYELENLNFDNKTSMKEQIINKLNFYTSISNTKNQFIPAVDNIEFNDTNVPNFFELFFNKSDFITFNNKKYKTYGISSVNKFNSTSQNSFGYSVLMQEGNNYRLGVNYEIIDSLKSYVLYTSTMFVEQDNIDQITKLPIYKLSTPLLEKYDIFNKKINEPDNMYKNQKKSYVSELKRIYKNNIKTRFI